MTQIIRKLVVAIVSLGLLIAAGFFLLFRDAGSALPERAHAVAEQVEIRAPLWKLEPPELGTMTFDAANIQQIRLKAVKAVQVNEDPPPGWSKCTQDPAKLLSAFRALRLKRGMVLRAYQVNKDGDANGVVWALPEHADFPDPDQCPRVTAKNFFYRLGSTAPKPPGALTDTMEAIEGDGSLWSYLAASLLSRQLGQFGAMWHGNDWSTHLILDENPLKSGMARITDLKVLETPSGPISEWKWVGPAPEDWTPQVRIEKNKVSVVFYTYSALHRQMIYRHTDTYQPGSYVATAERKEIAIGPTGIFF